MNKSEFIFEIRMPKQEIDNDSYTQICHVYTRAPHCVYPIELFKKSQFSTKEQQRLAILELKMKLIAEISNAEFTVVYE